MIHVPYLRSCDPCGKKLYADRRAAKSAIRILYPHERGNRMNAYPCPHDRTGGHHIGHRIGINTPARWPEWNEAATEQRCVRCAAVIAAGDPVATVDGDDLCLNCGDLAERQLLLESGVTDLGPAPAVTCTAEPATARKATLMPTAQTAGSGDPTIEIVTIDPAAAKDILNSNTHNRRLNYRTVGQYAADMTAGNWNTNGETIKIADDGTLIDGQHRLTAVIMSETAQQFVIVRGLPLATQETVDGGRKRSLSDILGLRGETEASLLGTAARRTFEWERGERRRVSNPHTPATVAQVLHHLEQHPELRTSVTVGRQAARRVPILPAVATLTHWVFTRVDVDDATWFFDRVIDGANLDADHAVAVLRRTLIESKTGRARTPEFVQLAYVIKAWNAYRDGRTLSFLRFRPGGANAESFPEPH